MSSDRPTAPADQPLMRPDPQTDLVEKRIRPGWHPSAMIEKPSLLARLLSWLFVRVRFGQRAIDGLSDATRQATVVYVLQRRSLLDYLYFNYAFLKYSLPLVKIANGVSTTWFRPWIRRVRTWLHGLRRRWPKGPEVLKATVEAGDASLVFLERRTDDPRLREPFGEAYMKPLIDLAGREGSRRILLVPLLLVWDQRSELYHQTLFDGVFGTTQRPGVIRKFFSVIKNLVQSLLRAGSPFVQVSGPLDLQSFVKSRELLSSNEKADELNSWLEDAFERDRRAIVGPPIKRAALLRREILQSERVDRAIRKITHEKPEYPWVVRKQARKMLKEIAADFSLLTIKFLSATVNPIFDALYRGFEIDAEGMEAVREAARDKRVVIIPSHKSHMDYLIISNVFYQHGLMPPHIAAGVNMSFWPMGPLFRRAGAFFLRRTFGGDPLYSAVFTEYLVRILREGFPIEFFIEGTRSRTGKLSRPRFGILSMIVKAALEDAVGRIVFVPVSVGYERVVEVRSYHKELLGDEKQSENLGGMLKATKVLRTKYGRVYVEFHAPLSLDDFIAEQGFSAESDRETITENVRRLSYRIIAGINEVTTVTPAAVVATALLNSPQRRLARSDLLTQTGFLVSYLRRRNARLSQSIRGALASRGIVGNDAPGDLGSFRSSAALGVALEEVTGEAVELFARAGACKVKGGEGHRDVSIDDDHRLELSYYRNNIVHFFVSDAILATALAALPSDRVDPVTLEARIRELATLFKYEFWLPPRDESRSVVEESLSRFADNGWLLRGDDGSLNRKPTEPPPVVFLRRLLVNWLETYWLVALCIEDLRTEPMGKKEFTKHCLRQGRRLYSQNRLSFYESLSKPTIMDALDTFQEQGVIVAAAESDGKRSRDPDLHIGADFLPRDRLRGVRAEIEQFLDTNLPEVEAVEGPPLRPSSGGLAAVTPPQERPE